MIDASTLGEVQKTMMIPLLGRALETKKKNGILKDWKSVEIVEGLNYDFSKFKDKDSRRSMLRTTTRTVVIDRLVQDFLKDHPSATVVELGCGLNTRFHRIDNGLVNWFDLDMPDVYEVWKKFLSESERQHFLPVSAFDPAWMERVIHTKPSVVLIISEASVVYFPENMIKKLFKDLAQYFPGQYYLFDSASTEFVNNFAKKDALKYFSARFSWAIDNLDKLKLWDPDLEILKTIDLEIPSHEFLDLYSLSFFLKTKLRQFLGKIKPGQYQLNLVKL